MTTPNQQWKISPNKSSIVCFFIFNMNEQASGLRAHSSLCKYDTMLHISLALFPILWKSKVGELKQTWQSSLMRAHVGASAQWVDWLGKGREKIAILIKGCGVSLRLHGLPHPSPPPSFLTSLRWIYYPLPLSAGLLNGPQLLNFMPRGQPSQFNGGYRAQVKRPGSFSSPYGLGEGGTNMNLWVQRSYELASYEGALQIGSISEMSWCIGGNL